MEYGTTEQVICHPRHPYTQGLLGSFPTLYGEKESLQGIPGNMPDLAEKPDGCVFASRCPRATEACRKGTMTMTDAGDGHLTACLLERR